MAIQDPDETLPVMAFDPAKYRDEQVRRKAAEARVEELLTEKASDAWHRGWTVAVAERDEARSELEATRANLATLAEQLSAAQADRTSWSLSAHAAENAVREARNAHVLEVAGLRGQIAAAEREQDALRGAIEDAVNCISIGAIDSDIERSAVIERLRRHLYPAAAQPVVEPGGESASTSVPYFVYDACPHKGECMRHGCTDDCGQKHRFATSPAEPAPADGPPSPPGWYWARWGNGPWAACHTAESNENDGELEWGPPCLGQPGTAAPRPTRDESALVSDLFVILGAPKPDAVKIEAIQRAIVEHASDAAGPADGPPSPPVTMLEMIRSMTPEERAERAAEWQGVIDEIDALAAPRSEATVADDVIRLRCMRAKAEKERDDACEALTTAEARIERAQASVRLLRSAITTQAERLLLDSIDAALAGPTDPTKGGEPT